MPITSPNGNNTGEDWARQAVVYQIYPRSFADSNGDGIGDLDGIISRVDYLVSLGVDAVWLTPFYPSALADGGYDVDDYQNIDPRIGTLSTFDELVRRLHQVGIKLIVDLVPNHSSNRHRFFLEALEAGPGSKQRDRYIFRDGLGAKGEIPPSDWQAIFGGPAWTQVADGQWYLHMFSPEQPDLNWTNEDVRDYFMQTLKFWADRGVDGFRVDVASALVKDVSAELPSTAQMRHTDYADGTHPLWDRNEVHDVYQNWRRVLDSYSPYRMTIAEAWLPARRRVRYASQDSLRQAFNFDLLKAGWDATQFREIIDENLELARQSGATSTWVFSNHDVVRHATRFALDEEDQGGPEDDVTDPRFTISLPTVGREWIRQGGPTELEDTVTGLERATAATLLMLALPGSAYLYQGEELGLREVAEISDEDRQDPTYQRSHGEDFGRDGARVPLPWTPDGPSFGFGPGGSHLPQPEWFANYAVAIEDCDPQSTLNLYRRALHLRRELQCEEELEWLDLGVNVLAFHRPNGWTSITNFGSDAIDVPPGQVLISNRDLVDGKLAPNSTLWLQA